MRPEINFTCVNESCTELNKIIKVQNYCLFGDDSAVEPDDGIVARSSACPKCWKNGELVIRHAEKNFSSVDALGEHLSGLAKEARLLKKLIDRSAAEEDEIKQYEQTLELLSDARCTCCGQPMTNMLG